VISIVTVSFNDAMALTRTIDSVRSQQNVSFEFIVIDGGSTDSTLSLLHDNSDIITRWISEPDDGIYDAINKGILLSTQQYINILGCGDVYYSCDTLYRVQGLLRDAPYVLGRCMYCYPKRHNLVRPDKSILPSIATAEICHQALFYPRSWHGSIGLYDASLFSAADYKFFMDAKYRLGIVFSKLPCFLAIRQKTGRDSSDSLINLLEMMKIDTYYCVILFVLGRRMRTLLAIAVKTFTRFLER
jgi:glycosyltransferase involved in cell wall biosynthesis